MGRLRETTLDLADGGLAPHGAPPGLAGEGHRGPQDLIGGLQRTSLERMCLSPTPPRGYLQGNERLQRGKQITHTQNLKADVRSQCCFQMQI